MAGDTVRGDEQSGRITLPFTRLAVLRSAVLQLFSVHTTCWTIDSIHTLHFHQEKLENNLVSSGPKKKKKNQTRNTGNDRRKPNDSMDKF